MAGAPASPGDTPARLYLPAGTQIEVGFRYAENGRLRIAVNVAGVNDKVTHEISREDMLTKEQLDSWRGVVVEGA